MLSMLKAALSTQLMLEQEAMDGEAKAKTAEVVKALAKRSTRVPHITNDNLNDASFHDSRYHADVAKGIPHNVAWGTTWMLESKQ
jgi:hypothetical protein